MFTESLTRSLMVGALGFAATSIAAFSIWAFLGRWFYRNLGEIGLYVAVAVVFVALAGVFLHPLVRSGRRVGTFYRSFVPAFLAYALAWCLAWFALGSGVGEWAGSLVGSVAFAATLMRVFSSSGSSALRVSLVVFGLHSIGYFVGSLVHRSAGTAPQWAALLWGLCYGLGFGAGIGFAYHVLQLNRKARCYG